jgi:hypothetical protein
LPKLYEAVARQWAMVITYVHVRILQYEICGLYKGYNKIGVVPKLWIWKLSEYFVREWIRYSFALSGYKGSTVWTWAW